MLGLPPMRLTSVRLEDFRNLSTTVPVDAPLAVVVGENNAGKSNLIDALRLLTVPQVGPRGRLWISPDDFAHDEEGTPVVDAFELEATYCELSPADEMRMVTCMASDGTARVRMRAGRLDSGRVEVQWFGGEAANPEMERWAREAVSHTYLPPLRDAAAELRPGRENRLVALLSALAPEDGEDRAAIEDVVRQANCALDEVEAVATAKRQVQSRLKAMGGGSARLSQRSSLAFADPRFERIVGTLRALAGHTVPLELGENGLGYNNLLFMAVLLAAMDAGSEASLHLLLVEEPEAHLHPQLQDLLMRYLEGSEHLSQVIVTSHSPNFAAAAGVERATVLARAGEDARVVPRAPRTFGLDEHTLGHLRRFLDVTKASLLFARGVILVEGVAEQLLLPLLARAVEQPLPVYGVTVVNVGGLAFRPFAELFGAERLTYPCAIVSDSDPPGGRPNPAELEDGDPVLSASAEAISKLGLENVRVQLARKTFEWDLAAAGNHDVMRRALTRLKPKVGPALAEPLAAAASDDARAALLLAKVADVKGPFAQALALEVEAGAELRCPPYIASAVAWATGHPLEDA